MRFMVGFLEENWPAVDMMSVLSYGCCGWMLPGERWAFQAVIMLLDGLETRERLRVVWQL